MTLLVVSPSSLLTDSVSTYYDAPIINDKLIPVNTSLIKEKVPCDDTDIFVITYAGYETDFQNIFGSFMSGRPIKDLSDNQINVFLYNTTKGITYTFYVVEGEPVAVIPFLSSAPTVFGDGSIPLINTASLLERGIITDSQVYEVMQTLWFHGTSRRDMGFVMRGYIGQEHVQYSSEDKLSGYLVNLIHNIGFSVM